MWVLHYSQLEFSHLELSDCSCTTPVRLSLTSLAHLQCIYTDDTIVPHTALPHSRQLCRVPSHYNENHNIQDGSVSHKTQPNMVMSTGVYQGHNSLHTLCHVSCHCLWRLERLTDDFELTSPIACCCA